MVVILMNFEDRSKEAVQDPVHYTDWISLLGFFQEGEAIQYIRSQGVKQITPDEEWLSRIRVSRVEVDKISGRLKLQPEVKTLTGCDDRIAKIKGDPTFQEHIMGMQSAKFAMVELEKIHCFQINLNKEYIETLMKASPEPDELEKTAKFCLPTRDEKSRQEVLTAFNPTTNTFSAIAENLDFRIIGNVQGEENNAGRKFAGFAYGFGLPQISVVKYKDVILLKNGYHRAFALLRKGHKFLPCLFLDTNQYQFTGGNLPGFFNMDLVMSDKSPVLLDFNSDIALIVPRRRQKMVLNIHAEIQPVPM